MREALLKKIGFENPPVQSKQGVQLTPLAAIQAGTLNGAKLLGWQGQIGALKQGYLADIVAVPGNPLADISVLQKVSFVMKGGVVYKK